MTEITAEAPVPESLAEQVAPTPPPVVASSEDVQAVADIVSAARRRPATLADLKAKKKRTSEVVVYTVDEDGPVQLVLKFQAISPKEFDDLVAAHPPTTKQKQDQMIYNPDTFGPALASLCLIEPKLSLEDIKELRDSGAWSSGEINTLINSALVICQVDAGVPFTVSG